MGVPDDEWGERVVAVVVAASEPRSRGAPRAATGGRCQTSGCPGAVVVVERLPVLPSGKADRAAVRRLVS